MFEILAFAAVTEPRFEVLEFHLNVSNAYPLRKIIPENKRKRAAMVSERALILIQPIAIPTVDDVMRKLFCAEFHTIHRKYFVLSSDEILEFNTMASNLDERRSQAAEPPVLPNKEDTYFAVCVSKENAIDELRQMFGDDDAIHVSHCCSSAHREIKFIFPNLWTKSIDHSSINDTIDRYIHSMVFPILSKSLLEVVEKCPPQHDAITQLRTALILRNPMAPITLEPAASTNENVE